MLFQDLQTHCVGRENGIRHRHDVPSTIKLINVALLSRLLILVAMAISCHLLPNHNPGDDVFKFSLRFPETTTTTNDKICFCLQGQACAPDNTITTTASNDAPVCADDNNTTTMNHSFSSSTVVKSAIYKFFLTPLTRWDASRFLDLAIYPSRRDPPRTKVLQEAFSNCDHSHDNEKSKAACGSQELQQLFVPSEQAHAFFPMLPLMIRTIANLMIYLVPKCILPPTYEGVATLAALIGNMVSFTVASLALYHLTLIMTRQQLQLLQITRINTKDKKQIGNDYYCEQLAYRTFSIFCYNPASVFFTSAYSESLFAMCNFGGHALMACFLCHVEKPQQQQPESNTKDIHLPLLPIMVSCLVAVPCWMVGSFTRSNGTVNSCWLLLQSIGLLLWLFRRPKIVQRWKLVMGALCFFAGAILVALPVMWHDNAGYDRHCFPDGEANKPTWCTLQDSSSDSKKRFSLYGYVQREHWNVGLFRYYTWKKIPNFLLAAPVLLTAMLATGDWIQTTYKRYRSSHNDASPRAKTLASIIGWAVVSLQNSIESIIWAPAWNDKEQEIPSPLQVETYLLAGPLMLGYYAVLAAVCVVGLLVAHVEITTRMIFSTCPAIYWYMALCCGSSSKKFVEITHGQVGGFWSRNRALLGKLVPLYCLLYMFLGVIMHPNWLPWT